MLLPCARASVALTGQICPVGGPALMNSLQAFPTTTPHPRKGSSAETCSHSATLERKPPPPTFRKLLWTDSRGGLNLLEQKNVCLRKTSASGCHRKQKEAEQTASGQPGSLLISQLRSESGVKKQHTLDYQWTVSVCLYISRM